MFLRSRTVRALALTLLLPLLLLGGCATTSPRDPFEPMNRAVYSFNDAVDTALIRPLAEGYRAVVPSFVRTGISNFFANINDVLIALNNLLQGKVGAAVSDVGRVLVNTTLGVGGLFDLASKMNLEKHNEDFGQTLGYWGIGDGPYLVLPFLGPSSMRDTLGRFVEAKGDPLGFMHDVRWRNSLWGARTVNQRAELLDTSRILETAALDPYEFLRDGYLQRRRNLIYDGSPPREKDEDANSRKPQPRASSPFPADVETGNLSPGTPLPSGEELTPARAAAREIVAAPAIPQQAAIPETLASGASVPAASGTPENPAQLPQPIASSGTLATDP
jgi:phospholipid-binding lipoprotein MlaA